FVGGVPRCRPAPARTSRKVIRHREVDRPRRRPRQRGTDSILPTSIRQGNSPRSKVTRRIWPPSRCGPPSHLKVRDVCWIFLCLPELDIPCPSLANLNLQAPRLAHSHRPSSAPGTRSSE